MLIALRDGRGNVTVGDAWVGCGGLRLPLMMSLCIYKELRQKVYFWLFQECKHLCLADDEPALSPPAGPRSQNTFEMLGVCPASGFRTVLDQRGTKVTNHFCPKGFSIPNLCPNCKFWWEKADFLYKIRCLCVHATSLRCYFVIFWKGSFSVRTTSSISAVMTLL